MATPNNILWGNALVNGGTPATLKVSDLIYTALRLAGVLTGAGRGYSPTEFADALAALNCLMDSWNAEALTMFSATRNVYPFATYKQTYSIGGPGLGADFDAPRPSELIAAAIVSTTDPLQPVELPMEILTVEKWAAIGVKNISSPLPLKIWPDNGFPLCMLNLWPIPNAPNQLALYAPLEAGQYATANDVLVLPHGYLRALQYNLAVELAPRFPRAVLSPLVLQAAIDSKGILKASNIQPLDMSCDPAVIGKRGGFNWLTGDTIS